ncbi:MAG: response regulator transcription factor [Sphingomonas sp.]
MDGIGHRDAGVVLLDLPGTALDHYLPILGVLKDHFATIATISVASVPLAVSLVRAGAHNVLVHPVASGDLLRCVADAATAQRAAARRRAATGAAQARIATLTSRENDVLLLLADGLANRSIAARLGISLRTAEVHRASMMTKLGVGSLAEALRLGYAAGALALDPASVTAGNT